MAPVRRFVVILVLVIAYSCTALAQSISEGEQHTRQIIAAMLLSVNEGVSVAPYCARAVVAEQFTAWAKTSPEICASALVSLEKKQVAILLENKIGVGLRFIKLVSVDQKIQTFTLYPWTDSHQWYVVHLGIPAPQVVTWRRGLTGSTVVAQYTAEGTALMEGRGERPGKVANPLLP